MTGIPSGSTCEVWESGTNGGITDTTEADPASVVIEPSLDPDTPVVTSVTVTNDFPLGELELRQGGHRLRQPAFTGGPYPVTVDCTFTGATVPGFPVDVEVCRRDDRVGHDSCRSAACARSTETDDNGATTVTYDPANADGTAGEVTVPSEPRLPPSASRSRTTSRSARCPCSRP